MESDGGPRVGAGSMLMFVFWVVEWNRVGSGPVVKWLKQFTTRHDKIQQIAREKEMEKIKRDKRGKIDHKRQKETKRDKEDKQDKKTNDTKITRE